MINKFSLCHIKLIMVCKVINCIHISESGSQIQERRPRQHYYTFKSMYVHTYFPEEYKKFICLTDFCFDNIFSHNFMIYA